jgi:hypothetical protein
VQLRTGGEVGFLATAPDAWAKLLGEVAGRARP